MRCSFLSWITWNPNREAFTIPYIDLPIMWYGVFFALGFVAGYFIFLHLFKQLLWQNRGVVAKDVAQDFTDKMIWYIVIGTVVGARLGHVFFYDWPFYQAHPMEIFMVRKGGLASHGGTTGVILGLLLFYWLNRKKYPDISFFNIIDLVAIPTALASCCIRLGNFINQEIIGTPSDVPWAIIFVHPAEAVEAVPRHPAMLYEAGVYLATFFFLWALWHHYGTKLKPGILCGLFFISIFGSRFFIEFFKSPQAVDSPDSFLNRAQYLSLPFVAMGIILLLLPEKFTRAKASTNTT